MSKARKDVLKKTLQFKYNTHHFIQSQNDEKGVRLRITKV